MIDDKTKKIKTFIIVLVILILIILIILFALLFNNKKNHNTDITHDIGSYQDKNQEQEDIEDKEDKEDNDDNEKKDDSQNYDEIKIVDSNNKQMDYNVESKFIKQNEYNKFNLLAVTERDISICLLKDFIKNAVYFPEDVSSLLNKEYKEKKFVNDEELINYLKSRVDLYRTVKLSKYKVFNYNSYDEYVLIDQYGNIYIFRLRKNGNYELFLDSYTVMPTDFKNRYNKTNDSKRAGFNIQRFIDSINDGDFKFAYNHLDENFRESNYIDINDFVTNINNKLFKNNSVEYLNCSKQGNLYLYDVDIGDANNENAKVINVKFVVRVEEKHQFKLSYSFEE